VAAARPLYLHGQGGTLALTGAFYSKHDDYRPLGEKPSSCASNAVPAIPGAASSKECSELGNDDFGAIDWREAVARDRSGTGRREPWTFSFGSPAIPAPGRRSRP
jgi:hypothetical protein